MIVLAIAAPFTAYPIFLMKILCFALFAAAFNLLLGFTGLLSFGHAAFFGGAAGWEGESETAVWLRCWLGESGTAGWWRCWLGGRE